MLLASTLYILLLIVALAGVVLNIVSLPGNWILFVAAVLVSWSGHWSNPSLFWLAIILLALLMAEAFELLGTLVGAKKFGASTLAAWAAIAGGLVGGILGFMLPVPLIGNLVGALLGAFLAAWCVELLKQKPLKQATWAAVGAAFGRAMGMAGKIAGGLFSWFILLIFAFPH